MQGARLPHLERGLFQALSGVAETVAWARGENPRDGDTLLSMRLMSPPSPMPIVGGEVRAKATGATITVVDATEGVLSVVRLDGYRHVYEVPALATVTTVRDAHLAQLEGDLEATRITAVASGADAIDITPLAITSLWDLATSANIETVITHEGVVRVESDRQETAVVELQAFSRGPHLHEGASAIITQAMARLKERVAELAEWGIGVVGWQPVADISAIAGAGWETRASTLLTLNVHASYVSAAKHALTLEDTLEIAS